jgi:hypothetical protein
MRDQFNRDSRSKKSDRSPGLGEYFSQQLLSLSPDRNGEFFYSVINHFAEERISATPRTACCRAENSRKDNAFKSNRSAGKNLQTWSVFFQSSDICFGSLILNKNNADMRPRCFGALFF